MHGQHYLQGTWRNALGLESPDGANFFLTFVGELSERTLFSREARDDQSSKHDLKIFVINLNRRGDRWQFISTHLSAIGLTFSRIDAVDAFSLRDSPTSLVRTAIEACWLSHQIAFGMLAHSAESVALILEDDAVLSDDVHWPTLLPEIETYILSSSIDVLQLGFLNDWREGGLRARFRAAFRWLDDRVSRCSTGAPSNSWHCSQNAPPPIALVPNSFRDGAHCYLISRRAARAFLAFNLPTFAAVDDFFAIIAREQTHHKHFRFATTAKSYATQRSRGRGKILDSDIEGRSQHPPAGGAT
jgi:hypothetical protein